jgi:class 3 adenylate cyclase
MADFRLRSLEEPDERLDFPNVHQDLVEIGDVTVARAVHQPGWRWSTDIRPIVGGDWCKARHVGVVVSGRMGVEFPDGTRIEAGPDDVFDIPPLHDGWVIGDEPLVLYEWAGARAFVPRSGRFGGRVLATLLFTDLVDSTITAVRLGDHEWRETLAEHYRGARAAIEKFHGREVKTTGDGILAMFDGPAVAIHCGSAIRAGAQQSGVAIRAGVHVGEVELVGDDIGGVAVHEAARVMASAATNEILVSETTRALSLGAGLTFEDRGVHRLKGLEGERHLFAYVEEPVSRG